MRELTDGHRKPLPFEGVQEEQTLRAGLATSVAARLKGLLGTEREEAGTLLLAPCRSIHTIGMRYAIDVAFVGETGEVLLACRDVAPGARLSCHGAAAVVERPSNHGAPWPETGGFIGLALGAHALRNGEGDEVRENDGARGTCSAPNGKDGAA